jgi:hypothetical protein
MAALLLAVSGLLLRDISGAAGVLLLVVAGACFVLGIMVILGG